MSMDIIIRIIAGVISTIGFAIIFRLRVKHIPLAAIDGLVACVVYFVCLEFISDDLFIANMLASFATAGFAEICARIGKAPATIFLLPGCIALVPGGTLYQAMRSLLIKDYNEFKAAYNENASAKVGLLRVVNGRFERVTHPMEASDIVGFIDLTE